MRIVRLIAVGDITLVTKSNISPFRKVTKALSEKDILIGNLETVLSNRGKKAEKAIRLHNDPEKVNYLKDAGFDILNLANNHVNDLGLEGFNETLDVLNRSHISFFGVSNNKYTQRHTVIQRQGIRLGFLGYYDGGFEHIQRGYGINNISEPHIIRDIMRLKADCDIVIISLHWGVESVFYPSPEQIELARNLIDTGASVVLGHGPRVNHGIEEYRHGLIAYSLGSFQFDFDHEIVLTNKLSESLILSLSMSRDGLESYDMVPIKIDWEYVPYIVEGKERVKYLDFITDISKTISDRRLTRQWWFEQIGDTFLTTNMYSWRTRIKRYGIRHALQCIRWLVSPFVIRCYIGMLSKKFRRCS